MHSAGSSRTSANGPKPTSEQHAAEVSFEPESPMLRSARRSALAEVSARRFGYLPAIFGDD